MRKGPFLAKKNRIHEVPGDPIEQLRSDPVFGIAQVTVLTKILFIVLVFDPRSLDTFTMPKSAAAHSLSFVLAALLLWLVVRHGPSILFWSPLHAGVGALVLAFALATPFALDQTVAMFGTFKRYLGLTQILDHGLLYLAVGLLFRDARSLRLLLGVGVGVALPVLAYGEVQRLGLDPFRYAQASTIVPISTIGNPDIAGAFLAIVGSTALATAMLWAGGLTLIRLAAWLVGSACMAMLFTTGFRAGVLAVGAGWSATILLAFLLPQISRLRAAVTIFVAALLGLGVLISPIAARLSPELLRSDLAVISRLDIWSVAGRAIVERPLLGIGPDNFVAVYPALRTRASIVTGELSNSTHDIWLYVATSAGIVGLAALVLLVVLSVDSALRAARRGDPRALALVPFAAYLGQALVSVNELAIDWTFWTSLGVLSAAAAVPLRGRRLGRALRPSRFVGLAALGVAALLIIFVEAPRLVWGENLLATEAYAAAHRGPESIAYGEAAVNSDSRRPEAWSSYGTALYDAGALPSAVASFDAAAQREPWHPLSWRNLAIALAAMGDRDAASVAAIRAVSADQYDGIAHQLISDLAYRRGDYIRAASEGEKAIEYELPPDESSYFTTISAYVQLKDLERAARLAREAVQRRPTTQLRIQYAAILADLNRTAEALSLLDAVLAEDPKNADALLLKEALLKR